jgi:hypothetical protein
MLVLGHEAHHLPLSLTSESTNLPFMDTLQELQRWYQSQCDGDWEHCYGVKIDTLDNPGWSVTIELNETNLADRPFTELQRMEHETDWIVCRVREAKFEGNGGPFMLDEILRVFLEWAMEARK